MVTFIILLNAARSICFDELSGLRGWKEYTKSDENGEIADFLLKPS